MVRKLVGLQVQRLVGQAVLLEHGRNGQRRARGLLRDQGVHGDVRGAGPLGAVPVVEHLLQLGGAQHRQPGDRAARVVAHGVGQRQQVAGHAHDGGALEQVGVVLQPAFQRATIGRITGLLQLQAQLELGDRAGQQRAAGLHVAHRALRGCRWLQHHKGLDQRHAAGVARQVQRVDDLFKRNMLVFVGAQRGGLHLGQQRLDCQPLIEIAAQRQRVGEVAHHAFKFAPLAVGDDGAGDHRGLAAVAVQQGLPQRQHGHEQRGVGAQCQRAQAVELRRRQAQRHGGAVKALLHRAAVVGGQGQ